ncbi:MAG: LuxR C-terminal-related transcriptional regulator [Gemmataceae bacterium]|nr:LuxR C-terminal-related transcriptional regulator [Gemmataceae bacterium]
MAEQPSVTTWLSKLRDGDDAAAQFLWERYFARLLGVARTKLRGTSLRAADEEDVALSAFHSFFRAADKFPRLNHRGDLWQVLIVLTARKACQERRRQNTTKRGTAAKNSPASDIEIDSIIGDEPDPEFAALVVDQVESLVNLLPTSELRQVARWQLEDYSNAEVAARLGCSERTVERKLALIRRYWEEKSPP